MARVEKATMRWSTVKLVVYGIVIVPFIKDDVIETWSTKHPRLVNSRSDMDAYSLMLFIPQEIIRSVQRYTNWKANGIAEL